MFDSYVSTQTTGAVDDDIVVVISSNKADSLCLLGVEGVLSIRVQQEYTPTSEIVADETISMLRYARDAVSASWSDYFFGEIEYRSQLFLDLDAWTSSRITLTITPITGAAPKLGHCLIGQSKAIGTALWGVSPGLADYSTVDRNASTGKTRFLPGDYAIPLDVPIRINNVVLDQTMRTLASCRATPAVWDANENGTTWESIVTLGFIREFVVTIPGSTESTCNLQIEGLI
jgi:hypothetical protein